MRNQPLEEKTGQSGNPMVSTSGGRIGRAGAALHSGRADNRAFVHVAPRSLPLPVLIAVPHAGRCYPAEILEQMRDVKQSQLRLEDRHVDAIAVEVARATGTGLVVAHAPRAMLDLNRAHDDIDWSMVEGARDYSQLMLGPPSSKSERVATNARARSGLGLVPRKLSGVGEIWRGSLPRAELARRIEEIHRPYHNFLERELRRIRDIWGAALLIDLHSMPPLNRQKSGRGTYGRMEAGADDQAGARSPHFVLGDRFGAACHPSLIANGLRIIDSEGHRAAHNRPYAGGYVLDRHSDPKRGIHAIQVEICRSTYLDSSLSEPTAAVQPLSAMLAGMVRELGAQTAGLGAEGQISQAAE